MFRPIKLIRLVQRLLRMYGDFRSRAGTCIFCERDYTQPHEPDCDMLLFYQYANVERKDKNG